MTPLLEARRVTKVFGGGLIRRHEVVALEDFSLSVGLEQPSITGVVGESGSGKTTMARLLLGLEPATEGEVLYRGKDLRQLSRSERHSFRLDVQMIFQDPFGVYNSFYRVDHALAVPVAKFRLARGKRQTRSLIEEALQAVGLRPEETLGRYPHQLSGGQRQRIMVARALLMRPKLIIADEPVSMIDASLRATVLDNLRQLNQDFGISLIYITHDLTTAYQISHDIIVLYQGSVAEAGDVELVVRDPQHPYTRLLISSIPLPDPDRKWGGEIPEVTQPRTLAPGGCKFAPRCPYAMPMCLEKPPPLFRPEARRLAACYLLREHPSLPPEELGQVMTNQKASLEQPGGGGPAATAGRPS
ncbi:MAG: ABC transporter ATP-binding protein [Anaerolineae bacterium]|nr:ABC transporter ATP-binding protein [Anaerolineae bacterium]